MLTTVYVCTNSIKLSWLYITFLLFRFYLTTQANTERKLRQVEEQLNEANSKLSDYEATIAALTSSQAKLQSETNELGSQLSEAESKAGTLSKAKSGLEAQVDDLKSELETESSVSRLCSVICRILIVEIKLAWYW